jgi:hypothetical protein
MALARRQWIEFGGVSAAVAAALVLIVLIDPVGQGSSGYLRVGAHLYAFEDESLFGAGVPRWSNFTFRGAAFAFESTARP